MDAVLGIAGSRHSATAALSVDGRLVAAASEDSFIRVAGIGYAQTGGFPKLAAQACLERAGLTVTDVKEFAIVNDHDGTRGNGEGLHTAWLARGTSGSVKPVDPVQADAVQAAASGHGGEPVLVFGIDPPTIIAFTKCEADLRCLGRVSGCEQLASAAGALARALGCTDPNPYRSLERAGAGAEPEFLEACTEAIGWRVPMVLSVSLERMTALVRDLSADLPGGLADSATPNVHAQGRRRALAASFMARTADLVSDVVDQLLDSAGAGTIMLGGALFEHPRLNTRIRHRLGDRVSFAAIPGERGRAIGASLAGSLASANSLAGLALGPLFSEDDIKATLENCRLDYVYEPDWRRLLVRVSKMLSRGMAVGWFHGPAGFGPRSLGTRSILCDPSTPYARENMNAYLKHVPIAEPLPLSMTPAMADQCLMDSVRSPYMLFDAPVRDSARTCVRAALDHRYHVYIHTVTVDQAPELCELLDTHVERTRVPGLINVNLSGPGEPTACTPRDAVRTLFSSATDALVIGRFLLMKDYWLLRNTVD